MVAGTEVIRKATVRDVSVLPGGTEEEDEGGPYFECLQKAQLDQDARPFESFILERLV